MHPSRAPFALQWRWIHISRVARHVSALFVHERGSSGVRFFHWGSTMASALITRGSALAEGCIQERGDRISEIGDEWRFQFTCSSAHLLVAQHIQPFRLKTKDACSGCHFRPGESQRVMVEVFSTAQALCHRQRARQLEHVDVSSRHFIKSSSGSHGTRRRRCAQGSDPCVLQGETSQRGVSPLAWREVDPVEGPPIPGEICKKVRNEELA